LPRVTDFDRFVFIVGAPRCGTTTLAHFLKDHPDVSFPAVKEPHFFAQHDLRGLSDDELRERVEEDYLRRFYRDSAARIGADASVTYLYTPEQLGPILRLWPDSRFVVSLRDPLSMLPSLHQRLLYLGDETIRDFSEAWAAVPDRAAGRRIPPRCADPRWLRYDEAARFGTYLERLYAVVGRERCMVLTLDDFVADTEGEYRRVMDFIGLDPVPGTDFSPRRSGYKVRFHALQRLLKRPPRRITEYLAGKHFLHRIRDLDGPKKTASKKAIWSLRKRLLRWNRVHSQPEAVPLDVQRQIASHYREEVERLEQLLGRDLGHWLQPEGASRRAVSSAGSRASRISPSPRADTTGFDPALGDS
jgi:hypothetical protein